MKLREKLKEARNKQGFSIRQVALSAGMSPSHLLRIESGERSVTLGLLEQLLPLLGLEVVYVRKVRPLKAEARP